MLDNIPGNIPAEIDYFQKLYDDLIQQFKGKEKITIFQKAMARQLQEVHAFFHELRIMRWLQTAEGIQLDGIGNIVDMSRTDALVLLQMAGRNVPMDDELYRKLLWFKIFLNTSDGTYTDVARTLKKFWPDTPFHYSEYTDIPATMFFTSEPVPLTTDFRILRIASRVKAAGVSLQFIIQAEVNETTDYHSSAVSVFAETFIFDNPDIGGAVTAYSAAGMNVFAEIMIIDNPDIGGEMTVYNGAGVNIFTDVMVINNPHIGGTTETYLVSAANIYKEVRIPE